MKKVRLIMFVLYMFIFLSAQVGVLSVAEDSISSVFEEGVNIVPSLPQSEEIQMRNVAFVDSTTGERLKNVHLTITIDGKKYKAYIGGSGEYRLDKSIRNISVELDDPATETVDYVFDGYIEAGSEDISIPVVPVGAVLGEIIYKEKGVEAKIDVICASGSGVESIEVGPAGDYVIRNLPVGRCTIIATYNNRKGITEVEIEKGIMKKADITLTKEFAEKIGVKLAIFFMIFFAILLFIIYGLNRRKIRIEKSKRKEDKDLEKRSGEGGGTWDADVMKLLSVREREVVKFLYTQQGSVSQKRIIIETGIPKTTIVRILKRLVEKKVIEMKSAGRTKRIKLSLWFREALEKGPKNGPERTGKTI